jgi:C-terminal processing protease CtpA/Prc
VVSIDGRTLATMDDRKLAAALVGPEGSVAELQIRPGSSGAIRTVQVCRSRSG